jgi:hypothetical protein
MVSAECSVAVIVQLISAGDAGMMLSGNVVALGRLCIYRLKFMRMCE